MTRAWLLAVLLAAALLVWHRLRLRSRRSPAPEQALLLHLVLRDGSGTSAHGLVEALRRATAGAGEVEDPLGDGKSLRIGLYGADAALLLERVRPVLRRSGLGPGSYAVQRRGEPGAPEQRWELGEG